MMYCVIDIGSNTIRFNVYKYEDGKINLLFGKKNVAGLASYREAGLLTQRGIKKLVFTLKNQLEIINNVNVDKIYAFASASLRNIDNSDFVVDYVKEEVGLDIEIISQEQEARLGFAGVKLGDTHSDGITCDIGGGSTEITSFSNNSIEGLINLSQGCLSIYKKYVSGLFPDSSEIEDIKNYIEKKLEKKTTKELKSKILIGLGGSIRATGNILKEHYDLEKNTYFTYENLENIYYEMSKQKKGILDTILQVTPERIHTVFPGIIITKTICEFFSCEEIFISNTGLREGFLLDKLKG